MPEFENLHDAYLRAIIGLLVICAESTGLRKTELTAIIKAIDDIDKNLEKIQDVIETGDLSYIG
jgi:hypothetical protein